MADQWGLMPEDYAADSSTARTNTYVRSIAITLLAYDTIYLIPDEVRYMYWNGPWSRPRIIHLTIRITTWIHALFDFYTQNNTFLSGSWCSVKDSIGELASMIFATVVKVLLVLRLCAVWNNNRTVTLTLYFLTAVETLVRFANLIVAIFVTISFNIDRFPLHGCYLSSSDVDELLAKVIAASIASRTAAITIETLLCLVSFVLMYRMRQAIGPTIHERISHVRSFTPLIYIVYRDGTLLFLPIWILSALGPVNTFNLAGFQGVRLDDLELRHIQLHWNSVDHQYA